MCGILSTLTPTRLLCLQVAEVAQILDFLSTQTALPIVGISGGSAVVIPYKVPAKSPAGSRQNLTAGLTGRCRYLAASNAGVPHQLV